MIRGVQINDLGVIRCQSTAQQFVYSESLHLWKVNTVGTISQTHTNVSHHQNNCNPANKSRKSVCPQSVLRFDQQPLTRSTSNLDFFPI